MGFTKNEKFWGMMILWIFFELITKLAYLRGHFYAFKGFFLGDIFGGC